MSSFVVPDVYTREKTFARIAELATGARCGLVVDSDKGPVGKKPNDPGLFVYTNPDDYVSDFGIPDSDLQLTAIEAARASQTQGVTPYVQIKRALPTDDQGDITALWGGIEIADDSSSQTTESLTTGVVYPLENYTFPSNDYIAAIFAQEPADDNSNISVFIDPDEGKSDEFLIEVYVNGELEEDFLVAREERVDESYEQMYIEDRVNENSDYIYAIDNTDVSSDAVPEFTGSSAIELGGGTSGGTVGQDDLITAVQEFRNPEVADIRLMATGGVVSESSPNYLNELIDIATDRKDIRVIADCPEGSSAQDIVDNFLPNVSLPGDPFNAGSYVSFYAPRVNDFEFKRRKNVSQPASARVLKNTLISWEANDPWFAVAGPRRGRIAVNNAEVAFDRGDQELLLNNNVNPIVDKPTGTEIVHQKTFQQFESALRLSSVRDLLLVLKTSIAAFAQNYKHEFNDPFTRTQLRNEIAELLQRVQGARGLENYGVKMDEENNPPSVRERGELVGDINIVPAIPAAVIILNFNIFPAGTVDFSESVQST